MNSTELRSGNLILWNGSPYRVTALDIAKLETYPDENVKAEGIVLTEEWLLKAGFEGPKYGLYFEHPIVDMFLDYSFNIYLGQLLNVDLEPIVKIKCLHKLQNLYFALTGQELTIKQD